MIHLYSGNGKGKTTAAVGLTVRALGAGKKVLFAQFLKGSPTSELNILNNLEGCRVFRNTEDLGFYPNLSEEDKKKMKDMHYNTVRELFSIITNEDDIFMIVLDEITYVMEQNICTDMNLLQSLLDIAAERNIEIVLTGRAPSMHLEVMSDYHTRCEELRHVFTNGVPARLGIEY